MYCADTSSWIAYLSGETGGDVDELDSHLHNRLIRMAPMVLAELLSDPMLPAQVEKLLLAIPLLELTEGFWKRAGKLRAALIRNNLKPKLVDTLIAQFCLDHKLPLYTRDTDFRPFAKYQSLQLRLHGSVN